MELVICKDLMLKGGIKNPHLDEKLKAKMISKDERAQLMAFLTSLTRGL